MKFPYLVLLIGIVAALIGLVAGLISAQKYGYLFTIIIVFDLIALGCFGYLFRLGGAWTLYVLIPGLVVIYTLTDVCLRIFWGVRILDYLR